MGNAEEAEGEGKKLDVEDEEAMLEKEATTGEAAADAGRKLGVAKEEAQQFCRQVAHSSTPPETEAAEAEAAKEEG